MRQRQTGAGGFLIVAALLFAFVGSLVANSLLNRTSAQTARNAALDSQFKAIESALISFVAQNGRLPCPAAPTAGTGLANPVTAVAVCSSPSGVVPWVTLGLAKDVATDPWGNLISYRVFDGTRGLTQDLGASAVNCDTAKLLSAAYPATAAGLCRTDKATLSSTFFLNKGLAVMDFGTAVADAAFVLVSHGPTGRGAYTSEGVATAGTAVSGAEFNNTRIAGPYTAQNPNSKGVDPGIPAHFDDSLHYLRLSDLITKAGQTAKDWPDDPSTGATTFNSGTLSAALGTPIVSGQNTGQSQISLNGGDTIIRGNASGGGDATIGVRTSNGLEGIGVGGTTNIVAGSESLEIEFAADFRQFGITLNEFGSGEIAGVPYQERVQFQFYKDATLVDSVIKFSCRPSNPIANFSMTVAADFDRVVVSPLTAEPNVGLSSFLISAVRGCVSGAATCKTTISESDPSGDCP